jgi:putative endonuclease
VDGTLGAAQRRSLGRRGEELAVTYLKGLGYELVARNWRTRAGELDIIARDCDWLVFVEVRTRSAAKGSMPPFLGGPEESVTPRKQMRLVAMAETYLFERPWPGSWRIDVIALELWPDGTIARLNHLRDAVGGVG